MVQSISSCLVWFQSSLRFTRRLFTQNGGFKNRIDVEPAILEQRGCDEEVENFFLYRVSG